MTTIAMPYRPQVDFFTRECFSVQYGDKNKSLECWQKVLIVALGILLVGVGGLALSYYWRERLVQRLYTTEWSIAKGALVDRVQSYSPEADSQAAPQKAERTHRKQQKTSSFAMPTSIQSVIEQISHFSAFLKQLSRLYVDANRTRLFCFNTVETAEHILIARFLFDAIPPGIYYVVTASTDRVAEMVDEKNYRGFSELVGKDTAIDLIIGHYAVQWNLISNPKTITKPYFKPDRICQILYNEMNAKPGNLYNEMNAKPEGWEAIYFSKDSDQTHHVMSDTITKFTKTWIDKSQHTANEKRKQAVQNVILKLQDAFTSDGQPVKI